MKKKYKTFILIWVLSISLIFGLVTTKLILNDLDNMYQIGGVACVIYFILLAVGNKFIASRARRDPL